VPELLRQGLEGHRDDYPWELVSDSRSAIRQALDQAQAGELVAILGGDIQHAIDISGEYSQRLLSHP
jgi:UDP-N-acetylmuramyl tripeptide synthase